MTKIKIEKKVDLYDFLSPRSYPSLSLFIDNHEIWPQNKKAMINLKNQLKEVQQRLSEENFKKISKFIEDLKPLCEDGEIWKNIKDSLIIYLSPEGLHLYQTPMVLTTSVHIGHFFDIRPLLLWGEENHCDFFLLKVSQKETKLFHISSESKSEIRVKDLPENLKEFSKFDSPEKSLQSYGYKSSPSQRTSIVHGQGLPSDHKKDLLIEYGKLIGKKVMPIIKRHHKLPLVLVGVSPLIDCVKESMEEKNFYLIHKNPDEVAIDLLSKEAKEMILSDRAQAEETSTFEFLKTYQNASNTINKIQDIIYNAYAGKIKELYIQKEDYLWGKFNLDSENYPRINHLQDHSEDLINIASIYTLQNGGQVHIFDSEKFACKEHAIAILR